MHTEILASVNASSRRSVSNSTLYMKLRLKHPTDRTSIKRKWLYDLYESRIHNAEEIFDSCWPTP